MSLTLITSAIATVGAGLAALGGLALFRLAEYRRARRRGPQEEDPFEMNRPMERYQPMVRLLAGEDTNFLRGTTGCPKIAARWEKSRRRIARIYLKELARDFDRLHAKTRVLVASAPEQYAFLVPILFKQKLVFWRTLAMIELRLTVGGWNVPQACINNLVEAIQAIEREISRSAAATPA
jgi:hypothetical protein